MGQVAAPLMIASSLVSAGSSVMKGNARAKALRAEAGTAEYNAKIADLGVKQIGATRSMELETALAAIDTSRAERGLSLTSPTGMALADAVTREHLDAQRSEELDKRLEAQGYRASARASLKGAKQAKIQGYVGALGSFMEAGMRGASMMGGARGGGFGVSHSVTNSSAGHASASFGRLR